MAYLQRIKTAKVVYAFPGHGKTPFAKSNGFGPWVDLDFGFLRSALRVEKSHERVLYKAYARLAKMYADEGYKILSNAPETIPLMVQLFGVGKVVMVLPENVSYSATKLGVDEQTASDWIKGWEEQAKKAGIYVRYTPKSFDAFMRKNVY